MNITDTPLFDKVRDAIVHAELIAWDGCHKIYLALDTEQGEWFRENEYEYTVEGTAEEMLTTLGEWYEDSCGLRFISGVTTNHDDPNAGFTDLISQFEDEEDEEDEEDLEYDGHRQRDDDSEYDMAKEDGLL